MPESTLLSELIAVAAKRAPHAAALTFGAQSLSYVELLAAIDRFAAGAVGLGLQRGERVAIYLEKRFEAVVASFGVAAAGAVFVPLNPLLKPEQVAFIMKDCDVRVLITSPERLALLAEVLGHCDALRAVVITGADPVRSPLPTPLSVSTWDALLTAVPGPRQIGRASCRERVCLAV